MENDIIKLLDLKESDIKVTDIKIRGKTKEIHIEHELRVQYCPCCNFRMHSKGIYLRKVNHPVMQDGYAITLVLTQRRWKCINPDCNFSTRDEFAFVDKYRRNTTISDLLIVEAFRDFNLTAVQISKKFNVSDTHAIYTFLRYVDMPRRTLTGAISIDEVFLNISRQYKYALVIQDFATGEPIDMVESRREKETFPYFAKIPLGERATVRYLISDMYRPYARYIDKYFHNAVHVVDAFHVIKLINNKLLQHIFKIQRRIKERDEKRHEQLEQELGRRIDFTPSKEYYLFKKKRWVILMNESNMKASGWHFDSKFRRDMSSSDYEYEMYKIDPTLKELKALKEMYIRFNDKNAGHPKEARAGLIEIIKAYRASDYIMFHEIADTLEEFFDAIINSFILVERLGKGKNEKYQSRLSNGPIEALNRVPKDMKRHGRGYKNFDYARNRFLFSQRKNAQLLGKPKTLDEVKTRPGFKRGPYLKTIKYKKNESNFTL